MKSYLSNRSLAVVVDGATSSTFMTNSGVPQGTILSPLIFLIFSTICYPLLLSLYMLLQTTVLYMLHLPLKSPPLASRGSCATCAWWMLSAMISIELPYGVSLIELSSIRQKPNFFPSPFLPPTPITIFLSTLFQFLLLLMCLCWALLLMRSSLGDLTSLTSLETPLNVWGLCSKFDAISL